MILAFKLAVLFLASLALAVLVGKRMARNALTEQELIEAERQARERAAVDAELSRLWVYHACGLKRVNLPEVKR